MPDAPSLHPNPSDNLMCLLLARIIDHDRQHAHHCAEPQVGYLRPDQQDLHMRPITVHNSAIGEPFGTLQYGQTATVVPDYSQGRPQVKNS